MNRNTATGRTSTLAIGTIVDAPELHSRIARALEDTDMELSVTARTADDLAMSNPQIDVVILYQDAAGVAGLLESVRSAREIVSPAVLIVVWRTADSTAARRALKAGADGLVNEEELQATLATTIRVALAGLVCVPRQLRAPLESESLSMREKQVLGMLVRGCTNAEIAARLFLAESTVKSHLSSAYTKLGVRTRRDATTMILDPAEGLGPGILAISAA
jgi:DNA-binding NarL/FixJ family response regulator